MDLKNAGNSLKLPLGAVGTVAGAVFLILSVYTLFFGGNMALFNGVGEWWWWIFIGSAIALIVGGYYLGDAIWRRRKFKALVYTKKKSEFVKNEREINKLLSGLPKKYKAKVEDRKKELKIRE
jgi:hypothetical protein